MVSPEASDNITFNLPIQKLLYVSVWPFGIPDLTQTGTYHLFTFQKMSNTF